MPTFIHRRIQALVNAGIQCYVFQDYRCLKNKLENIHVVPDFKVKNLSHLFQIVGYFIMHPNAVVGFYRNFRYLSGEGFKHRVSKAIRYCLFRPKNFRLIHVQWITHILDLEWMKKKYGVKLLASVRGSMVTIYPYKYPGYEQRLLRSFELADSLHFVSYDLMDFCVNRWKIDRSKCFVNYNGISLERFRPSFDRDCNNGKITLVGVGALIWRKNFKSMVNILSQLDYKGDIELRIIGEGEERFMLEFLIEKLKLKNKVKLLGAISSEDVLSELQRADIYLSTSYAEGLSNSVMEAAACGLPVVAFDCEGMSEVIVDGVSGYIVPHGNECAFVEVLNLLLQQPAKKSAMGRAARLHIEEYFGESIHIDAMVQHYVSIASSR